MELMTIVTMLALIEYFYFGAKVGIAREKYEIKAPQTTGNEMFERYYRVHCNTAEQLISFIPALWAFGYYVSYIYAAGLGVVYLVGRILYCNAYIKEPNSRAVGAMLSGIPCIIMMLGGLIGAVISYSN